jgi:DNA-binding NarL/FixJ family response regulator
LAVDDHPLVREGIARWINGDPSLELCGEASNAPEAVHAARKLSPDLVLCDITLQGGSGLELLKELRALNPEMPVVMLSMHEESIYALRALRAGARGYLMKRSHGSEMLAAIKDVIAGGTAFSPTVTQQLLHEFGGKEARRSTVAALSDREFEILQFFAEGKASNEIAVQLNLSPKTIQSHRVNIRKKLHIKSTPELIRYAIHCAGRPPGS